MISIYVAMLLFGGILLGASVFLGGDDASAELDGGAQLELEGLQAELDAGTELEAHDGQLELGGEPGLLWPLKTARFWTFFTAFAGLTGLTLELLLVPVLTTAGIAMGLGLAVGSIASWTFRKLAQNSSGQGVDGHDYIGKSAQILVPLRPGQAGKIRVQVRGQSVDLLALSDGNETLGSQDDVMIIEMQGSRARVARLDPEDKINP